MEGMKAKLFGAPMILANGQKLELPYKKADALLYYLIYNGKVSRTQAVELLWPDVNAQTALKNLRHAIYSIRKELGWDPFLGGQRSMLELNPALELDCDVLEFLKSGDPDRYGGEFLKDFAVPKAQPFEDWLTQERVSLLNRYLKSLLDMGRNAFQRGDLEQAAQHCRAYVEQDPLEEGAVVLLMRIYCAQQRFRKAIGLYHELCKNLSAEFGISPLKETTTLYYRIVDQWNASTYRLEEDSDTLLLGKAQALRRLLALGTSKERRRPCVLLQGEAGVGKTYLLDYALEHYDFSDWLICRSFCYQTETNGFLSPWNSIMLALTAELELRHILIPEVYIKTAASLFPCLAPDLETGLAVSDQDYPLQAGYHVIQRSLLAIFSIIAKQTPILLIFEDIHWMDSASTELMSLFLRRLHELDIGVICTSRDILPPHIKKFVEAGQRDNVLEKCTLQSFTREETRRFLARYAQQQPEEALTEQIFQNTGGNALLLVQILDSLRDGQAPSELPRTPEDIIGYRLSVLSADERQLLDLIAVFAGCVSFDALVSILRKDTLSLTYLCHQLTQKKLLAESSKNGTLEYAFAHERIKDIVSQRQSESGRRILHLRVAQYLEEGLKDSKTPPYDLLRHHYALGGDRFKTFQYQVLALNAYAGLCYELLPTLTADPDSEAQGHEGLTAYFQTLETELNSLRHTTFGEFRPELKRLEMILLHTEGRYCIHDGLYSRGLEILQRLLEHCWESGDWYLSVQAHLQFIYYGIQTFCTQVMEEHLDIIKNLLWGKEHSGEYGIYLRLSGLLCVMEGRYEEARALLNRSIQTFLALDSNRNGKYAINIAGVYNYMAESYRLEGDYCSAFHYYDQAISYNRSRGYYPGAAVIYTNYGVAAYQNGQVSEARQLFRYAVEIYTDSHEYSEYPIALSYLALYDAQEQNYSKAAEKLTEALTLCETIGSPWWKGITLFMLWKIRQLMKERQQSCGELEAFWPAPEEEHCRWCLSCLQKLPPRIETTEMEHELLRISQGTL